LNVVFFFAKDVTGRLKSFANACISAMQIAGRNIRQPQLPL
jgi:hypothetical protein